MHDFSGYWSNVELSGDFDYPVLGVDVVFNIFEPPKQVSKECYFDILDFSLYLLLRCYGLSQASWRYFLKFFLSNVSY